MRMPLLTTISEDSLLAHLIRMGTPPSYKLLTIVSMVGVPTVLFYLLTKKKHIIQRRVSGSAAAEVIGCNDDLLTQILLHCNDDLLTQILLHLPVKTLVRFKCVSKQWSSLISSEFFTRRHVGRVDSRQPSFIMTNPHGFPELFICHHTKKKLVPVDIPSPIIKSLKSLCEYNILQSWNGLLLMEFLREDRIDYFVFNPTTKQYRLLQLDGYRPLTLCFVCDPSKPEYYKVLIVTSITPYIYSVYDLATQEWSHNMQGGDPFKDGAAFFKDVAGLGFYISTALLLNLFVSSIKQGQNHPYPPELKRFSQEYAYDNYIFESMEHINLVQVKTFPVEENKLKFRVGEWNKSGRIWMMRHTDTLGFKNSSAGVRMLGMTREKGAAILDAVFLFHIPGQLLIYKINQGVKVLVDYRREHFYVKDEWQFENVHSFIHTFAAV